MYPTYPGLLYGCCDEDHGTIEGIMEGGKGVIEKKKTGTKFEQKNNYQTLDLD